MKFTKYQALGNDYVVLEPSEYGQLDLERLAPRLCHRNYGIGSDGLLLGPLPSSSADFGLRIINPDGSEAEKSGNGLRIFARYLWDTGRVGSAPFAIETKGGKAPALVSADARSIRIGMGRASFDSVEVGVAGPRREVIGEDMDLAGERLHCTCVSVGNPHCVISGVPVNEAEARRLGPRVETDVRFRNRTNVQLLHVVDRARIEIQIWERGAGYTLASGSSASAAACAARRLGWCDGDVIVQMPGGELRVEIDDDYTVTQTGPATRVGAGEIFEESWVADRAWSRLPQ